MNIRKEINNYLKVNSISTNKYAKDIGVNQTSLRYFLVKDKDSMCEKVINYYLSSIKTEKEKISEKNDGLGI